MEPDQLMLSPLSIEHAEAIQLLASHPDIAATTRIPHPYPDGAAMAYIHTSIWERKEGKSFAFALMKEKTLIGVCSLMDIVARQQAELGYWIGKPYWGNGYASFAVKSTLQFAFEQLHLQKVFAIVLEKNYASERVLEKNGFIFLYKEAHNNSKWPANEKICLYELTREEWQKHTYAK